MDIGYSMTNINMQFLIYFTVRSKSTEAWKLSVIPEYLGYVNSINRD